MRKSPGCLACEEIQRGSTCTVCIIDLIIDPGGGEVAYFEG